MEPRNGTPLSLPRLGAFEDVLHDAERASADALERLRRLGVQFPASLPPGLVDQLERGHADPASERRRAVRLAAVPDRVAAWVPSSSDPPGDLPVVDRSANGLAVRVGRPLDAGAVVAFRLVACGAGDGWYLAQVRYCRADAGGWVAGCEFLGDRPPG